MQKNKDLLSILKNLNAPLTQQGLQAMDALILAGFDEATTFRQAIIAHKEFWKSQNLEDDVAKYIDTDEFLIADGIENQFSFKEIYQTLAEKRFCIGLSAQNTTPEMLQSLLVQNTDLDFRTLAGQDTFLAANGKMAKAPHWDPSNDRFLTTAGIKNIKTEAQRLFLLNKIKACPETDTVKMGALKNMLVAGDESQFRSAAESLGIAPAVAQKLNFQERQLIAHPLTACVDFKSIKLCDPSESLADCSKMFNELPQRFGYVISKEEIVNKQIMLAPSLLCHPELSDEQLASLSDASSLTDFKTSFQTIFKSNDLSWLKPLDAEKLRSLAAELRLKAVVDKQLQALGQKPGSRPELFSFLFTNPFVSRANLYTNPKLLSAILAAENPKDITAKLRLNEHVVDNLPLLARECERINECRNLQNAALAANLANLSFLQLEENAHTIINLALTSENLDNADGYKKAMQAVIKTARFPENCRSELYKNLGLTADGNALLDQDTAKTVERIRKQRQFNLPLIGLNTTPGPSTAYKALYWFLGTIDKKAILTSTTAKKIADLFKENPSLELFVTAVDALKLGLDFKQNLTLSKYQQLRRVFNRETCLANPQEIITKYQTILTKQALMLDKIALINEGLDDTLDELGKVVSLDWLNPAFPHALEEIYKKQVAYEKIARDCTIIVQQLQHQEAIVSELLIGLAKIEEIADSTMRANLEQHRLELENRKNTIALILERNKKVYKLWYGDRDKDPNSLAGQGILQAIKTIIEQPPVNVNGAVTRCKRYNKAELEAHLKSGYTSELNSATPTPTTLSVTKPLYESQSNQALKNDEFLEHVVGTGADAGYFIEQRDRDAKKPWQGVTNVSLTVSKFPGNQRDQMAAVKARCQYALAMANQLLANAKPSPESPIYIQGDNEEQMMYLWTAVMIVGERLNFDHKSIVVISSTFDASQQVGLVTRYGMYSVYNQAFKKFPELLKSSSAGLEKLMADSAKNIQQKKEANQLFDKILSNYQAEDKATALQDIEKENESEHAISVF